MPGFVKLVSDNEERSDAEIKESITRNLMTKLKKVRVLKDADISVGNKLEVLKFLLFIIATYGSEM